MMIVTLVERDGDKRSFHVPTVNASTLAAILKSQVTYASHCDAAECAASSCRSKSGRQPIFWRLHPSTEGDWYATGSILVG